MDFTTSIFVCIMLLVLTIFLYNWAFSSWNHWTLRGIPSAPGALPLVGNTLSVFRLHENFSTLFKSIYDANRDKSMVGFYKLNNPTLLLRDPELVKIVLQTSFKNFHNNESIVDRNVDPLIGRDVFFIRGEEWKESRSQFVSAFSSKRLKTVAQVIGDVCKKMENHLEEKIIKENYLELEAKLLFSRFTTEVAARSVLSIEGNSFVDDYKGTFLDFMKITMDVTNMKAITQNVIFFLPSLNKFLINSFVPPRVDTFYRRVVKEVENARRKDGMARSDVLQLMLDLEKEQKISRADLMSRTFSFFLESFESSSLTLSFVAYELAKHPKVQNELRKEIESVFEKYAGQMTYEAINELIYTEQVVNESLRLFPPVGALIKLCTEKYRLEGFDGLAVEVEPDTPIVIPVMGLHMDPQIWENPEEFNPERFSKGNEKRRHKFSYLPFGEGPRACPGMRLAMMQVKAAIATIVRDYRIELSPKMKEPLRIDPRYFQSTALGGVWITLHPLKTH